MCTLTIFPKNKKERFILTFSRDEMPSRSSIFIENDEKRDLVYPKDALHGGTWLAFNPQKQRFVCLLNGAFEVHKRLLPYRKSRGLVVLDSFDYEEIYLFCIKYDFEGIEPFTMILWEHDILIELRWNGEQRHIKILDNSTPHIYSSCTLYNKEVRQMREKWFSDCIINATSETQNLKSLMWEFHMTSNIEMPEKAILMQRPQGPCTVSISQLDFNFTSQTIDFQYYELGKHKIHQQQFDTATAIDFAQ